MWGWLIQLWERRPDGAAAEAAQQQVDEAVQRSRAQGQRVARVIREQQAVRRETDQIAREIERTMRPRRTAG